MANLAVSERVKQVMIQVLDLDVMLENLGDEVPLYSSLVRLDSLTLLRLITELEKTFGCQIDDEAVMTADLIDVGSIVSLVSAQLESGRTTSRPSGLTTE
jgi:acyl carrier protein